MQPIEPYQVRLLIELAAADGGGSARQVGSVATAVGKTACCSDCLPIYRIVFDDGGAALCREDQFVRAGDN